MATRVRFARLARVFRASRACIALTKSEEKERLLAVYHAPISQVRTSLKRAKK